MKKAQAAMEFIWMYGFALLLLFVFSVLFASYLQGYFVDKHIEDAHEQGYAIQQEIIIASVVHDGYYRTFNVPQKIGLNYFYATINDTQLTINYTDYYFVLRIPDTSGQLISGDNVIRKTNGEVELN